MPARKKLTTSRGKAAGGKRFTGKPSAGNSRRRRGRPPASLSEKIACMAVDIVRSALEEGDRKTAFWVLEHHPRSPFRKDYTPEPEGRIEVSFGQINTESGSTSNAG